GGSDETKEHRARGAPHHRADRESGSGREPPRRALGLHARRGHRAAHRPRVRRGVPRGAAGEAGRMTWSTLIPPPQKCGCCERSASECDLRRLTRVHEVWKLPEFMCRDCFVEWYDGGLTDPEAIKARVLGRLATAEVTRG